MAPGSTVQACTVCNGATDLPKQELDTVQLAKQAMGTLLRTHVTAHMIRQVWHCHDSKNFKHNQHVNNIIMSIIKAQRSIMCMCVLF